MHINPYLGFNGNCRQAFEAYEKTLRGKITMIMTNGESPMAAEMPAETRAEIMHVRLEVGDQVLMGGDNPTSHKTTPAGFCVAIALDTPEEAERIFNELSKDGQVQMPMQETFWAHRFGMCIDRFLIPWIINCNKPMPQG